MITCDTNEYFILLNLLGPECKTIKEKERNMNKPILAAYILKMTEIEGSCTMSVFKIFLNFSLIDEFVYLFQYFATSWNSTTKCSFLHGTDLKLCTTYDCPHCYTLV